MPPLGKSDHAVFLNFCCDVKTVSASHASSCNYQKGKYDELQNSLDIDWDQALCPEDYSVDEMWHLLKNKLLNGIDKYIPMTCNRPPKRHAVQLLATILNSYEIGNTDCGLGIWKLENSPF